MILVLLGTQDKPFTRLLDSIEKIESNQKIIVQAGNTEYFSNKMEIFDLISSDELHELIKKADLIITHGGVGSIIECLRLNKKIIAAARLKEYGEHVNNHQSEIIEEFEKEGYILKLDDFNDLQKTIKKAEKFKLKKFSSNNNKLLKIIEDYIDNN